MSFSSSSYEITAERIRRLSNKNKRKDICADNTVVSRAEFDAVVDKCDDAMKKYENAMKKCDALEQFKASSTSLISDMREMIIELNNRVDHLQSLYNDVSIKKAPVVLDSESVEAIKKNVDLCLENIRMTLRINWNPYKALEHADNAEIADTIMNHVNSTLHLDEIKSVVERKMSFKLLRRTIYLRYYTYKDYVTSSQEDKECSNYRRKINSRKAAKLKIRKKGFELANYNGFAFSQYGTEEECNKVLNKSMLSDDEDAETVANGKGGVVTLSYSRYVPSWRSEKLNNFYKDLDKAYYSLPASKKMMTPFQEVIVERKLDHTEETKWEVPNWALSKYAPSTLESSLYVDKMSERTLP